jgi:hypothetical protein
MERINIAPATMVLDVFCELFGPTLGCTLMYTLLKGNSLRVEKQHRGELYLSQLRTFQQIIKLNFNFEPKLIKKILQFDIYMHYDTLNLPINNG